MKDEENATVHLSVLRDEVLAALIPAAQGRPNPLFVDCTLGGGGHTEALLERIPELTVIALDQDELALARAKKRLREYEGRVLYLRENFANLANVLAAFRSRFPERTSGVDDESQREFRVDGILADLGLSSDQLSDSSRGFSFRGAEPLDMRMDIQNQLDARTVLNDYSAADLERVFYQGGMRRSVRGLVNRIIANRPVETTEEFRVLCEDVLTIAKRKKGAKKKKQGDTTRSAHVATVPFQAIRIEVNGELEALRSLVAAIPNLLVDGGRAAIITFHSLEDELVTRDLRRYSTPRQIRRGLPPEPALGRMLSRSPIEPGAKEIRNNPRARSARLRVFERTQVERNSGSEELE